MQPSTLPTGSVSRTRKTATDRRLPLHGALVATLVLIAVGMMSAPWPHFLWRNEPLHSWLEAAGGFAAILMAAVLLQRRPDEGDSRFFWVALGLLGGGLLDSFHAISQTGQGFVLLHSMAVLVAGLGFALVWLPPPGPSHFLRRWGPGAVIAGSTLLGAWTLLFHDSLPVMMRDGGFTATATVMNLIGGFFFTVCAGRLVLALHRSPTLELYLFCSMAALSGLAAFLFPRSAVWDDAWWFWHGVRLLAYLLVMAVVARTYLRTAASLRSEVAERRLAEERLAHAASVLKAVRSVTQLVVREKDRQSLIQQSCDLLVERNHYPKAWIVLLGESRHVASAGLGEAAPLFEKQLESGTYPDCVNQLLPPAEPCIEYDPAGHSRCGCVLAARHTNQSVFRWKLEYEGKLYGAFGITVPSAAVFNEGEQQLFRELCGDIAFALATIEREEKRKRAEEDVHESNRNLEEALAKLRKAQTELLQQERIRALGQMASGIAHDFNNSLTPILGYTAMLLGRPEILDDRRATLAYLRTMNLAAEDAAGMVRRLRSFCRSREEGEVLLPLSLKQVAEEAMALTEVRWRDQAQAAGVFIKVSAELDEVPPVDGCEAELREALTNLILNAVDAMPQGGTLNLGTRAEGDFVVIEVRDTGVGMSEEIRRRCMEPFFTTKGSRGTGLGLALVHGVVQRHDGLVAIESAAGKGTAVTMRLPTRRRGAARHDQGLEAKTTPRPLHVLMVDDDPAVLRVVAGLLAMDGHTVETAGDGRQALEKYRAGRYDLVLTDMGMPEMSGDQLTLAIKQLTPRQPVVMLTGFGDFMPEVLEHQPWADLVLGKPITLADLRQALAKVLANAG